MAGENEPQRITRLTPLADVLTRIDELVRPLAARPTDPREAFGGVLAEDMVAAESMPSVKRALRDGFAVRSEATSDASSYAPAPLAIAPLRVDTGEPLPEDADAVVPLDAVIIRQGRYEIIAPVAPGEGVLAANGDVRDGEPLRRAGQRLRAVDIATAMAACVPIVALRWPRIRLVTARMNDRVLAATRSLLARGIETAGGAAHESDGDLAAALADATCDAVVGIGGTGSGRNDASVHLLKRMGHVEAHGIALTPGETVAFGLVGARPVLLLPGRIDAALAGWLLIGRHLLTKLTACVEQDVNRSAVLARKVVSPAGFAEAVPVRIRGASAEPIASGYWSWHAIAQADGWIFAPADSEGYPAGTEVVIRPWL